MSLRIKGMQSTDEICLLLANWFGGGYPFLSAALRGDASALRLSTSAMASATGALKAQRSNASKPASDAAIDVDRLVSLLMSLAPPCMAAVRDQMSVDQNMFMMNRLLFLI